MRAGQQLASMLRWTRAWRLPREGLGPHGPSFARVPVAPSSSSGGRGGAEPRLLDGEAALPAVVFLHGLFGSKTNFSSIAKILAQQTGRRVLTVDARNHGDSPHSPDMSYEIMSQDLQELLPQLGLVPCAVVGHSMGGKTAMLLALQRPELVERLIAVDISPVESTGVSHFATYVAAMRAINIPDELPRSHARKLADEQLSSVVQDMVVRQFLLTNLVEVDGRFVWKVNLDALTQHLDKILAFPQRQESYLGPTLFLLGGNSQFVHPSHHPEIMRLFPRAQMQTVPNTGHWIHADRPQDFIAAIRGFLV
ncbi:sn-1-specific diacylglycerol lipase ABHD11 isoform X3 [Symphalangus syndactylus]|uniref:sn-1-specific diacylglycerol lipase ABHD11 isoform X3 n=1 Tax=Symphalangus syndactylus TaxID=9590 RepID=UPI002440FAA5|nr:protein ABHD11 isoform X2 [Symphalangus syndactylus]